MDVKRRTLTITGVTRCNRYDATAAIEDAIIAAGGWLIDHALFSNVAATFRFVLPPSGLVILRDRIAAAGIALDGASGAAIAEAAYRPSDADTTAVLNMTFIHDEPDLRRVVPAVPG